MLNCVSSTLLRDDIGDGAVAVAPRAQEASVDQPIDVVPCVDVVLLDLSCDCYQLQGLLLAREHIGTRLCNGSEYLLFGFLQPIVHGLALAIILLFKFVGAG